MRKNIIFSLSLDTREKEFDYCRSSPHNRLSGLDLDSDLKLVDLSEELEHSVSRLWSLIRGKETRIGSSSGIHLDWS